MLRLIDAEGKQLGIVTLQDALQAAKEANLDLVEIQPNTEPPVAKIEDFGKRLFELKKQRAATKKKQKQIKLKEQKFRPSTDTNDYEVKLRNLRGFLENGDRVKITVWFRGREMAHQDLGMKLLERVKVDLADLGKVDFFPKLEGKQLVMILAPKQQK
jgi:translation initiation factor IF-3